MKTEVKCSLSGTNVVRTYSVFGDDGKLQSENVSVQGDRDTVLAQLEAQVVEAKRDRDGILNPGTSKPTPADGSAGEEVSFWTQAGTLYKTTTRRTGAGKFQSQSTEPLGTRSQRLENAEDRLAEITRERDAILAAK